MRLDLAESLRPDPLKAGDAVRLSAPLEFVEPTQLRLPGRDDDLPVSLRIDSVGGAVVVEPRGPLDAEPRLQRPGGVVDAGVDHPAGVAALVGGDPGVALEHHDFGAWMALLQLARGGEADD